MKTKDDKRRLLAEYEGWVIKIDERLEGYVSYITGIPPWKPEGSLQIPDYLNNLNAMYELCDGMEEGLTHRITGRLLMQVGAENREGIENFTKIRMARADQWAEAVGLELQLWE